MKSISPRWALHNNRLLLGAFEDLDQQTESDLLQIVEDALGGIWEKSVSKREGRRDAMLDRSTRLRGECFGRRVKLPRRAPSYSSKRLAGAGAVSERREKRTVWYHVANAFSLLVSSIEPGPGNKEIKGC